MKRKILSLLMALVMLLPSLLSGCRPVEEPQPVTQAGDTILGAAVMSKSKALAMTVQRTFLSRSEVDIALLLDGVPVPLYDEKTYFVSLDETATEGWGGGKLSTTNGFSLAFVEEEVKGGMWAVMKRGTVCTVYAYNDTHYCRINILFTALPVMTLDLATPVEEVTDREKTDCLMTLFQPHEGETDASLVTSAGRVNVRGATSALLLKKSYRLELYRDDFSDTNSVKLLNMRKDDDWVLYPAYSEEAKIRDAVSWVLWEQMASFNNEGATATIAFRYIEVICNGQYFGLYVLMERVDEKGLNLETGDGLIKARLDRPRVKHLREMGPNDETCVGVDKKFPDPKDAPESDRTWQKFADYIEVIYESNDKQFVKNVAKYTNIENALDYWLFIQFIMGWDNAWKNCYYAIIDDKVYCIPWDLDLTFGMSWYGFLENYLYQDIENAYKIISNHPGNRLIELYPGAANYVKERYAQLVEDGIFTYENVMNIATRYWFLIQDSGAYARDAEAWPRGNHVADLDFFAESVTERIKFFTPYVENLVDAGDKTA